MFSWREKYFWSQFGHYGDENCIWFTFGFDDSHCAYTVPYQVDFFSLIQPKRTIIWIFCQVTQNFDEVVALACSPAPSHRIYFEYDEIKSFRARDLYDSFFVISNLKNHDPFFLESISHLTYSDALHVILAVFQNKNKPLSMQFFAMKKVLELNLEVKDLPQELQVKVKEASIVAPVCCN